MSWLPMFDLLALEVRDLVDAGRGGDEILDVELTGGVLVTSGCALAGDRSAGREDHDVRFLVLARRIRRDGHQREQDDDQSTHDIPPQAATMPLGISPCSMLRSAHEALTSAMPRAMISMPTT